MEQRAAVRRALPQLDDGAPLVLVGVGAGAGAGVAEAVVDGELDGVVPLQRDAAAGENLAAKAEAEPDALGVGLGEDELGRGERDAEALDRALDAAKEELQELGRLRRGARPAPRWLQVRGA